ncbi:hypothetical protein B7P43_G08462 [Cryptotermes secundus]|uniref:Chitin-binding type-2 domain-containing protein n=3 Tax=Cryptotermes secundus TaxID=105785 RepID=A0A2J7QA41_9NEOP|nr:hypothetical protein B7P43_G08462 [Cryptotermes secundus]
MFHVCTIGQKGETTDIKFLCLNGTVFDQETRVCERVDEVDCSKTEGFYDLNLELYGNGAALSFTEEEEEEEDEETTSEQNTEASDTPSHGPGLKHKTSTSRPSTVPPPISTPIVPHPASTTTPKIPAHPFVPTTTFKPSQHITHFHSTTPSSVAAFLAINNAFSSSNTNQDGNKFGDDSSQYDEDDEEGEEEEEEEEEEDTVTHHPGIQINSGISHHFPVTTVSSQVRPVSPEHHNIPQQNVKVHGTGESGLVLNQSNRQQPQKSQSPLTHSAHLYGHDYHQTPHIAKDENAHSKHQLNTQFILNQQRDNENKQLHGFKPISNTDNRNQFLFSSTTQQPPILYTTKSLPGYHSPTIESFSLHAIDSQPAIQTTQRSPNNSPFPPQTNAHQVPPNTIAQKIRASIASNGGFLAQTIQISPNPLIFHLNSKSKNRQGHQLFTTPSVAVIATTSSSSSSSSVRSGPSGKAGNISPVVPLTSSTGNTPKGSSVSINSSVPAQLFSETTPPDSYDEYQEADVASDPFFRDVPKISRLSTTLNIPSPTRHGIIRNKREAFRKYHAKSQTVFQQPQNTARYRRKAVAQFGLPTEVFRTGEGRYRNRPGGPAGSHDGKSNHQSNSRGRTRAESQSRKTSNPEELVSKESSLLSKPSPFVAATHEVSTVIPETYQEPPQYSSIHPDIRLPNFSQKHSESATLDSPLRTESHQGHKRTFVRVRGPHKQNVAADIDTHNSSQIPSLSDHTKSLHQFMGNSRLNVKSVEATTILAGLIVPTSGSIQTSHEVPKPNVNVYAGNPETLQDSRKHDSIARTYSRGENRRLHHQPSQSNLDHEKRVASKSESSRQRSSQGTRLGAADNVHETREYQARGSLTSQLRDNIDTVKSASRESDHRHSNSENTEDRTSYSHHAEAPSRIRSRGRKFGVSSTRQDRVRLDGNGMIPPANDSDVGSGVATEPPSEPLASLPETNFSCADKIPGGYYADLEADCQLFHICSVGRHGRITDNKFLCGPGTRFNQRSRTCQVRDLVDCNLSASLYYLNSHFKLESPDDISKYNVNFEAHKIRTRREAPKAASSTDRGPRQHYTIDNLPQTSFTCEDKPQDGLYADVETQCQVFHLCRTISGQLTLESSFVCPPGTVFNQPEGNCDTWKEVDCALYSAPEHSFKKTATTGTRGQGSKDRNKRQAIMKGTQTESPKQKIMHKLGVNKNYRFKRGTEKETFDYYDYVDDNYEAHAAKPENRDMSPGSDQTKESNDNFSNVEDNVSTERHAKPGPHLFKSEEKGKDGQQATVSAGNGNTDSNTGTPEHYESFLPYAIGTLVPTGFHHNEAKGTREENTPLVQPYELSVHNKSDEGKIEDTSDYIYEYEYVDEIITTTSNPRNIKQTESTLNENNKYIRNYAESTNPEFSHDLKSSNQSVTVQTNDFKIIDLNHSLDDTLTFSTNIPGNIPNKTKNDEVTTKTKIVPKVDSVDVTSDDYEYEYYYDEGYTEANSNSKQLSSANGHKITDSEKQSDYCAHCLDTEEVKHQKHRPAVAAQGNLNGTHENSNFGVSMKVLEKLNVTPPAPFQVNAKKQMHFGTDITAHDTQKSGFIQTGRISELFETNENPSLMQEMGKRTTDTAAVQNHKKLYESNYDEEGSDDIYLASHTTHLPKETFDSLRMETTTSHMVLEEETSTSHELNSSTQNVQIVDPIAVSLEETTPSLGLPDYRTTIATTAESQKEGTSPNYSTTSYADVIPYPLVGVPLSRIENQTFTEAIVLDSSSQTPLPSPVPSLLKPPKLHNIIMNHFSTPIPPPAAIQSSNTLTSRKPTLKRNQHRGTTDNMGHNIRQDEGKLRKSHRFTLLPGRNPTTHVQQMHIAENTTTTLATSFVADNPVIDDQETRPQNRVPNIQSSETIRSKETSSTVPHKGDSTYGIHHGLESEILLPFTRGSESNAKPTDKLISPNNGAFYSSQVSTEAVSSSEPPTIPAMENSALTFTPEYENHDLPTVNSSVIYNDDIILNRFRADNYSIDYAIRNNFELSGQNSTTVHVFPANDLTFPVTTPSSLFKHPSAETTEVLPSMSPSLHAGYTLSSVNSQPSISVDGMLANGFVCTGRELHRYHADTDDCRIFHYCSAGFHSRQVLDFRFMCENGTAFKADTQKCENEFLVPTCVNLKVKNE